MAGEKTNSGAGSVLIAAAAVVGGGTAAEVTVAVEIGVTGSVIGCDGGAGEPDRVVRLSHFASIPCKVS